MTPFQGIIKFTIELVPIPEVLGRMWIKCWDQSNLSLQNLPQIFLWWSCFWKYLEDIWLKNGCPDKKVVVCAAYADWSACQISNLWDQPFTFFQINRQMLNPIDPQNIFWKCFAFFHHLKKDWMISDGNWSHNNNLLLETLISYNAMA